MWTGFQNESCFIKFEWLMNSVFYLCWNRNMLKTDTFQLALLKKYPNKHEKCNIWFAEVRAYTYSPIYCLFWSQLTFSSAHTGRHGTFCEYLTNAWDSCICDIFSLACDDEDKDDGRLEGGDGDDDEKDVILWKR